MSNELVDNIAIAVGQGYYRIANLSQYKIEACRSCHASIVWAKTKTGHAVPLDLGHVKRENGYTELLTHFATCPQSKAWRKK